MHLAASQRISLPILAGVGLLAAGCFVVPPGWIPFWWAGAAAATGLIAFAARGDLVVGILGWFVAVMCLGEEFWRVEVPFFFNLTLPRILIVALVVAFAMMWALGRVRLLRVGTLGWVMLLLAGYFTVSAAATGWQTKAIATVHYRLIGGYWFAFAVFVLMLWSVRREVHVRWVLWFFFAVSAYLCLTGWAEHFKVWALVWPSYISDPLRGIHWGRARGPFLVSAAMGLACVFCFFSNTVLARHASRTIRWPIYAVNLALLPVIFWTKTRAVWLSLIVCGILWVAYSRRRLSRTAMVCGLAAAALLVVSINFPNIATPRREVGGVTDPEPIYVRIGLALITWEIVKDHPLTGVGFGHFRDVAPRYAADPASEFFAFASTAMQHNNLLSIAAETGLIGLALYLVLLWLLLRESGQLWRRLPPSAIGPIGRDLVVLWWVLFAGWFIDGLFRETSVHPFANSLFFGLSGAIVALNRLLAADLLPQPLQVETAPQPVRTRTDAVRVGPVGPV